MHSRAALHVALAVTRATARAMGAASDAAADAGRAAATVAGLTGHALGCLRSHDPVLLLDQTVVCRRCYRTWRSR
jgi:hypothetical protein